MWNDRVIIHWLCRSVVLCFLTRGLWTDKRCSEEKQSGMRKGRNSAHFSKSFRLKKQKQNTHTNKKKQRPTFVERSPREPPEETSLPFQVQGPSLCLEVQIRNDADVADKPCSQVSSFDRRRYERGWKQISSGGFVSQMSCWHFVRASISYTHTHTRMYVCLEASD